ncbi:hypothetical protein GCM10010401_12990 [Rarobacter faecitabidus]|uniref:Sensory transduction regulator n=1 Tax=Rarobacter faecitabidus TaxID=13243 RepID=A0A542ZE88_RARFA|nr:hypothetical protein [Rarobacter faecitabidus]TQL58652.1 hypothetical protein FB461_2070 [Rarobacter faecitabidus]
MTPDDVDLALRDIASAPSVLLGRVVTAFEAVGLTPTEIDWEQETFDAPELPGVTGPISGIVMQRSRAVVFHRVHDVFLSPEQVERLEPVVIAANSELDISAVEVTPQIGALSLRAAVEVGDLELGRVLLGEMMTVAIRRVAADWEVVSPALIAAADGEISAGEAKSRLRPHL